MKINGLDSTIRILKNKIINLENLTALNEAQIIELELLTKKLNRTINGLLVKVRVLKDTIKKLTVIS